MRTLAMEDRKDRLSDISLLPAIAQNLARLSQPRMAWAICESSDKTLLPCSSLTEGGPFLFTLFPFYTLTKIPEYE